LFAEQSMSDLAQLEAALESHGGTDVADDALPPGFREKLDALRAAGAGSPEVANERHLHMETAERLINQLDSADNIVVKMSKKRVIHAELNAVKVLDAL
jgi:hypothetical protein